MSTITEDAQNRMSNALRGLEKAKALERKRLDNGCRYVKVSEKTSILVECDEQGHPNEQGMKRIAKYKRTLNC